jgi:hypothetical protein
MHPSVGYPHVIIEFLFGCAIHRPQRMHDQTFGAKRIGDLVSP